MRLEELVDSFKVVDVWVGTFTSLESFEAYLSESYEGEDEPISRFAADQEQSFYDHDFLQAELREPTTDLVGLMEGAQGLHLFVLPATAAYRRLGVGPVNAYLLVYGMQIHQPRSVEGPGYHLDYLGQFPSG